MDSLSLSNSVSKETRFENTEMSTAYFEDLKNRKDDAITNERIQKDDIILDTYEVTSDAISGGMGSVWRVHHNSWNTDLAMKRPQPRFFAEGGDAKKAQFVKECEYWINLGLHPNIVSCYYVREIGGVPTIFSEWMDGGSLSDRINDGSLYEGTEEEIQERILDIAIQAARGLQYSHENGLIHQDFKPGNLLLTKDWDAKVADFGLAKAKSNLDDGSDGAKTTGYTLAYCPQEQINREEPQKWMDVYSWALTVLEMYAGKRLWNTGAEAKEHFDGYRKNCKYAVPDKMQNILKSSLIEKTDGFTMICKQLTFAYRELIGKKYIRSSDKAVETSGSMNNRALSFIDLGFPEKAEAIWNNNKLSEDACADCNRTIYKYLSGNLSLDGCIDRLNRLLADNPDLKDIGEIIKHLKKRKTAPKLEHYSVNYDISGMDKVYIHTDQRLALMHPTGKSHTLFVDLKEGRVIRTLETLFAKHWDFHVINQLQIDNSGRYILDSHVGESSGMALQVYHIRKEDMKYEVEKDSNYPFLHKEKYPYATFVDDKLITMHAPLKSVGMTFDAADTTALLEDEDADGLLSEKVTRLYSGSTQNKYSIHFSRFGKRYMTEHNDISDSRNNFFEIFNTLTGERLFKINMPLREFGDLSAGVFVIDDDDRFLLCAKGSTVYWYDLTLGGRNTYVWDIGDIIDPRGAIVHTMRDGERAVLLYGDNRTDFVRVPIPKDSFLPQYILKRVFSIKETVDLETESDNAIREIKQQLNKGNLKEALTKWNEAHELELFTEHRDYSNMENKIDFSCRKKKLNSCVRVGGFAAEPCEYPKYSWKLDSREYVLTLCDSKGRSFSMALFIRDCDGRKIGSVYFADLTQKRVMDIAAATASPYGNLLAVLLDQEKWVMGKRKKSHGMLIFKVSGSKAEKLAYFDDAKEFRDGFIVFQMMASGLYFATEKQKGYCIAAPDFKKIKRVSSSVPAAAIKTDRPETAERANFSNEERKHYGYTECYSRDCRSVYVTDLDKNMIIKYSLRYEYEIPQMMTWDKQSSDILKAFKAMLKNPGERDIRDLYSVLCRMGYGYHPYAEIEHMLKK